MSLKEPHFQSIAPNASLKSAPPHAMPHGKIQINDAVPQRIYGDGVAAPPLRRLWLFNARIDLSVFLGSAVVSLALVWLGKRLGALDGVTPEWTWVPAVLLIDVAHVYATGFRVYFDAGELKRRPVLYTLAPMLGLLIGIALYTQGELVFWRVLAYLAVFHFVRQQYGWVMLYRARLNERDKFGWWLDAATIYSATIYPLVYWHAHLPRRFWWFLANDFTTLPHPAQWATRVLEPVYWLLLIGYAVRALYRRFVKSFVNPGKDIIVATTAACWYVGIVAYDSDYAFTVTNIVIHGVPYLALVYRYARARRAESHRSYKLLARNPFFFLATLWVLAYAEELLWDRGVWHERAWLFGTGWNAASAFKVIFVPLLALPQITHYVLDGFVWRRKSNPELSIFSPDHS